MSEQPRLETLNVLLRDELEALAGEQERLSRQFGELVRRRKANQERLQAIRVLLGESDEDEREPHRAAIRLNGGDLAGMTVREGWRTVLDDTWRKPAEIAERMQARGYSDSTPTPLATRVGNDLWREAKKGRVEKKKGGFYRRLQKES